MRLSNGRTVAETRGSDGYPKTELGTCVQRSVESALERMRAIRALPPAARAAWEELVRERHAVYHRIVMSDGGFRARTLYRIRRDPTGAYQRSLVARYDALTGRMAEIEDAYKTEAA